MSDEDSAQSALDEAVRSIGSEVLEQTGGDHYRAGQPLQNTPESAEPTSTEVQATVPQPPPAKETETPTVKGFGPGGKYTSIEDWEKGTIEAGNTISALRRELDEAKARPSAKEPVVPEPPPQEKDPLDELEMLGVPKGPVREAIRAEFQGMLSEVAKDYTTKANADRAIIEKYPEYQERFGELQGWLTEHPEVNQDVEAAARSGQHVLAREYAWLKFTQETGSQKEAETIQEAEAQTKTKAQKRVDAQVTDTKSGHTRDQSSAPKDPKSVTSEELTRATNLAKSGYERKAWAELLNPILPGEQYFQ